MTKYLLTYEQIRQFVKDIEVEGPDIRSVLNAAPKLEGFTLKCIEEQVPEDSDKEPEYLAVYAFCESCGQVIGYGDEYRADAESGVYICMKCDDEAVEDQIEEEESGA